MDSLARVAGVGAPGLAIGSLLLVLFVVIAVLSVVPDAQFKGWPRGVFPDGEEPDVGRYRGGIPPIRTARPDFTPAEGALVSDDPEVSDVGAIALVDLAARGYIAFVEFRELAVAQPSIAIVARRKAGPECTEEERALLALLARDGACEAPGFDDMRPMDPGALRLQMQDAGIGLAGTIAGRVSGIRTSLSATLAEAWSRSVEARGWFMVWKKRVASVGALLLLASGAGVLVAFVAALAANASWMWLLLALLGVASGLTSIFGTEGRSALGSVARDQTMGYARYLVDVPRLDGVRSAAWVLAARRLEEWTVAMARAFPDADVAREFPWLHSTVHPIATWRDAADLLLYIRQRLHAEALADDSASPLPAALSEWAHAPAGWSASRPSQKEI